MPRRQWRKSRSQFTLRKVIGRELTRRFRKKIVDPDNVNQAAQISPEQVLDVLTPVASELIRSAWDDSSFGFSVGSQSNQGVSRRSIQPNAPTNSDSTATTTVFRDQKQNIQCGNDSKHINIIEDDSIGSKKKTFQGRKGASSDAANQFGEQQLIDVNKSRECILGDEQVLQSPPKKSQGLHGPMEPEIEGAEEINAGPPRILYIQNDSTFSGDASSSKSSTSVSAASKEMQDPQEPMGLGGGLLEFKKITEEVPEIIDFQISTGDRSASKSSNPVPLELQIGDMVRVTKKNHVKFGLEGIITKQTACFVYFRESTTNSIIQIKRDFVTRIANETPASPCHSTISYTTFFSANAMNDTAYNSTTSLEVESRKQVMVDDILKPGDYVRVSKEKHPKCGTHGFIERITICFAFVNDSETRNTFRIKPEFLSLCSNDTQETKMNSTLYLKQERQHPLTDITHEVHKKATSNLKNKTEGTEGRVKVKESHAKHGGKFGTIQRKTQHFHFVKFDENPSKEVRVKSRFLTHLDSLHELDMGNDAQINSRTGAIFDIQSWEVPPIPDENRLTFGNFPIERVVVSTKQELDVDCVFKLIWNGRWKKVIFELDPKKNNELPKREFTTCRSEGWELYYAEVDKTKVRGQHLGMYHQPKTVTAYYVQTEGRNMESVDLLQRELLLGDFSTLSSRKVWDRRHLSLSPAKKIHGQYAIFQVASRDIEMVDDVGTTGCGFIEEGYMEELLGGNTAATRALAIQVRIHVPSKGIFKGMLMRKRGMTGGRIELNESLQKVSPSQILEDGLKDGFITIKQAFPSDSCNQVDRIMTGTKMVTKTFTKGLRNGTECKFPTMVARVWEALNVPVDKITRYLSMSKSPANLRHSCECVYALLFSKFKFDHLIFSSFPLLNCRRGCWCC
mmetsp:Transcript_10284/g.22033  ORF Transcript_10284/g.22033 Transcript_10284/m.22033 type:complete len:907 (+) Transcript_10284:144-2864(+)